MKVKENVENGHVENAKATAQKYRFRGFGDLHVKSRTPVQFVLDDNEQFLKLEEHFIFMHFYLEDKAEKTKLRQGRTCLVDGCGVRENVAKSIYDVIGSLARH